MTATTYRAKTLDDCQVGDSLPEQNLPERFRNSDVFKWQKVPKQTGFPDYQKTAECRSSVKVEEMIFERRPWREDSGAIVNRWFRVS